MPEGETFLAFGGPRLPVSPNLPSAGPKHVRGKTLSGVGYRDGPSADNPAVSSRVLTQSNKCRRSLARAASMSGLPRYSEGDHGSAKEVGDAKSLPPGYGEAAATDAGRDVGRTYAEKFVAGSVHDDAQSNLPCHMTVHATENENFVFLNEDARPIYYVDNSSSLSQTILRSGDTTNAPIISTSSKPAPFVREIQATYESRVRSGTSSTTIIANGKFSVTWTFIFKHKSHEWKHHKGVWTLYLESSQIASYNVGQSLDIEPQYAPMADVILTTVSGIDLFARLTSERRQRALNSVHGRNSSTLLLV